jgi:ATP-dependent Clp protease ATP-binding subunit ClpC
MFERYAEKTRRAIFNARDEAQKFGASSIETEHLLLGAVRDDPAMLGLFLTSNASEESIRAEIEAHATKRREDLPLSNESKRVLAYAAEEANRLGHKRIDSEHLLLGMLREERSLAALMLHERGAQLKRMRKELAARRQGTSAAQKNGGLPILRDARRLLSRWFGLYRQ